MLVHVLGSAAGGGFPQWNCNCHNCTGVRNGTIKASIRTQSSIAVSADGESWVLFNTSPDILTQLQAFNKLQPNRKIRDTAIEAIIFVDAQIDHTTGLLMLREGCPHNIYCTNTVHKDLTENFPILTLLKHWGDNNTNIITCDGKQFFTIAKINNLQFTAVPVVGKAPPYSPHRNDHHLGDNIALYVEDLNSKKSLFYAPGLYVINNTIKKFMQMADCIMVDGTVWTNDELIKLKVSDKLTAKDMGHLPQSGAGGMLEVLADDNLQDTRKILIHINNTNPILNEDSPERHILTQQNVEVAYDGMDIIL